MSLKIYVNISSHLLEYFLDVFLTYRHFINVYKIRKEKDEEREESQPVALVGLRFPG